MTDVAGTYDAAILREIMQYIALPKTVDQIADEFDWHPQTARRYLWQLQAMGKARSLPRKDRRKKLWQAVTGAAQSGEVTVMTSVGAIKLSDLAGWSETAKSSGNLIGGFLAYVWRRSFYKGLDQSDAINVARQGSLDIQLEVYPYMVEVHKQLKKQVEALEQMLVDMPELFNEAPVAMRMIGNVDRTAMEEAAHNFEPLVQNWLQGLQSRSRGE